MITERISIHVVIRGGLVVPDKRLELPEGTDVEIVFDSSLLPQELQDEFAFWDGASDNAWAMITELEQGASK